MAAENIPINEDDDLFNFDEMMSRREEAPAATVAKPAIPATVEAAHVTAPSPTAPAPIHVEPLHVTQPASSSPGQIGQFRPVVHAEVEAQRHESTSTPLAEPLRRQRAGAFTPAALLIATLVNMALAGVVWRSMAGMGDVLREVGDHVALANGVSAADGPARTGAWRDSRPLAPAAEAGELALALAGEEIKRGEFERARARLYSLLSVIDRFDAKSRGNLASRAQVLAADSFREQADAVERQALALEAPGFVAVSPEKQQ